MGRTVLSIATYLPQPHNRKVYVSSGTQTINQANGMSVQMFPGASQGLFLDVYNGDSTAHNITVRVGHAAYCWNAGAGDLVTSVRPNNRQEIGPIDMARHPQAGDNDVWIDFDAGFTGDIVAEVRGL